MKRCILLLYIILAILQGSGGLRKGSTDYEGL
jgi:hypothetical protein